MKILALDQARNGAYSIWDYDKKKLLRYGTYRFDNKKYTYPQAIRMIENLVENLIYDNDVSAVFIEDINLRANVVAFKCLAQLQGVLVNLFEKSNMAYSLIPPSTWQAYCQARGRTSKEKKSNTIAVEVSPKKKSKVLSLTFVKDKFGIDTMNDDLCDSICIGWYVVNNIDIESSTPNFKEKKNGKKEK